MKLARIIIASFLLFLALPIWRMIDWAVIIWPSTYSLASILGIWAAIFLCLPIKLLRPTVHPAVMMLPFLIFWGGSISTEPLSKMATNSDKHAHCGQFTYSGLIYPIAPILSDSFKDDLEARNQMCWLRKMIQRVPEKFDTHDEINQYLELTQKRLLLPEHKYRVALPFVLIFLGKVLQSWNTTYGPVEQFQGGMMLMKGIPYWTDLYNHEISARRYSWWNWPHSSLIKFEYGLIEENWENLQIQIQEQ